LNGIAISTSRPPSNRVVRVQIVFNRGCCRVRCDGRIRDTAIRIDTEGVAVALVVERVERDDALSPRAKPVSRQVW
jgi:hypothetical protein